MTSWIPTLRVALLGLVLSCFSSAAIAADPLTLFLLRMLRDQAISATIESATQQQPAQPQFTPRPPVVAAPQTSSESAQLKALIDESFLHLGPAQREELHASLQKMLGDPRNAAVRSEIISEFTRQAVAMRDAHRHLSRLSETDMRRVAEDARSEFERLSPDQRKQLLQALQQGVPGMPRALHDMMMAEFASVPAAR
jgi:hypothetical protein